METARLEQLGLRVEESPTGQQATLELGEAFVLENPVTRQPLGPVTFQVAGERLVPMAPPAVVGLPPIPLGSVGTRGDVALVLTSAYDEYLFHIERRSAQLHAMGLHPNLHPETLELSTELEIGPLSLSLVTDRLGQFRVSRVVRDGQEISGLPSFRFELFDFRDRDSLASYLSALIEERLARPHAPPSGSPGLVRYEELARAFGPQAVVPPRSALELLVQVRVKGEVYRFAAARVQGRTFRGLLAGARGKVWSERFELDAFPGIVQLVADLFQVSPEAVQLLGPDAPQE
ncbi:hypothetical protein [Hyalangium gracile]|uniref:hypothetical protein n=1 Tax=Hyalangium gracile TaxID=394092 RepID=UPI001CCD4578|nr:hypothetical protein [Hyalangium gracile]